MRIYIIDMDCKELMPYKKLEKCPRCHGSGEKHEIEPDPAEQDGSVICKVSDCPECQGTGFAKKQKEE